MRHVLVLVDAIYYVVMKTVIVCIIHTRHVAAVFVVDGIVEYIKILIWILVWNTLESIITPFTSVQIVLAHQGEARTYDRDNEDRLGSRDSDTRKEKPFFFEKFWPIISLGEIILLLLEPINQAVIKVNIVKIRMLVIMKRRNWSITSPLSKIIQSFISIEIDCKTS